MLDIAFIRNNADEVEQKAAQKGYNIDATELLKLDEQRRDLQMQIDDLRQQRNQLAQASKSSHPDENDMQRGRSLKEQLSQLESQFRDIDATFTARLREVPNLSLNHVPVGKSEADNVVAKTVGELPNFDFTPMSHHQLGEMRGLIDKERAAKISGSRFAYLKGDLVRLQFAIISYVIAQLSDSTVIAGLIKDNGLKLDPKAFTPVIPPAMLKTEPYQQSARLNAEEVTYKIEQDDLWLNASAEHTLCTMYMNEIIDESELPIRFIGYSTSFRREAGSYGKDMEGILRLHQFDKLEMEVLSSPETGLDEHRLLIAIQEHLVSSIGLPYQLISKCTADIGKPNASGVDINCWFPAQNAYRETHTADYMTDYQSRDLKIRYRRDNNLSLIHTNDATAFALGRIMAAIIENNQTEDGRIRVPEVLVPLMGRELI